MPWEFREDAPIYTQLIAQIQQRIVGGLLGPGARLPSVRDLAAEAGVNPNTMQRALTELEREGIVHSQRTPGGPVGPVGGGPQPPARGGAAPAAGQRFFGGDVPAGLPAGGDPCPHYTGSRRERGRRGEDPMSILETKGLVKRFGPTVALDGMTLAVEPGRIVGLLGPNGSGKTTLIKLANGLLVPDAGEIWVDGHQPGRESYSVVSYLPERNSLPLWMTVDQLQDFYADFFADFQRKRSEEMLDKLEIPPKQKLRQMSKGTREKVQLILTMSRQAKLYLLDEPIGGVDPAARDYILDTIIRNYDPEAAVILSTHLIADVERILDEVIFVSQGQVLFQSTVDAIREEKGKSVDALFREVYKC